MFLFYTTAFPQATSVNMPINRFDLSLNQLSPNSSIRYKSRFGLLPVQMCVDTFSQPQAMARLSQAPPVKLVQSYYECTTTLSAALMASIGNAAATSTLYVGIGWTVFGALFILYLKLRAQRTHSGAIVLTEDIKMDLEATQDSIRRELVFEALMSVVPAAQQAKLQDFRSLFYEQEGEPSQEQREVLERCGVEISQRLLDAEHCQSASHGPRNRRITITLSKPESQSVKSLTGRSDEGSLYLARNNVNDGSSRRLSSHPMSVVLSGIQPPTRSSLSGSNRRSFAHNL